MQLIVKELKRVGNILCLCDICRSHSLYCIVLSLYCIACFNKCVYGYMYPGPCILGGWPLCVEWASFVLPRILSDTFYSRLKTLLFSRARVGSASE